MIVVDCAALVDALVATDAVELRDALRVEDLHAPALVDFEFVSALRGLVRRAQLSADRALDALTDFDDLTLRRWPSADALRRRAFQLRDVASAYDAAYVALAEALECPLVTRDRRLARSCGHLVAMRVH